jgi:tetratricopeptide (TPR) repeat protein
MPADDIAESAEAVLDEQEFPGSPAQGTQDDIWPLPTTTIAPLQQADIAVQTASAQQSVPVPLSKLPTAVAKVSAAVHEPMLADRSKPVAKPLQKSRIRIVRAHKTDPLNQRLLEAYHAYQTGNYTLAARHYHDVLEQDATNRDALLGLAAIAQRNGDRQQSADYYITLLKYDPRDSTAISGLVSLQGASLTVENESRMKMLLDQEPKAAHLHFTLGTLYAGQSRWADAQQSFFNAHRYAPENADYAYNLAVSLDRIGKQTTALEYYRRAVKLASKQRAMFNLSEANERIHALVGLSGPIR